MSTNRLACKTLSLNVSDISPETRKVVGYFASFNTIDSMGDMFLKGAFTESIASRGPQSAGNRKIAHLWNHQWDEPVGKLLELNEDDKGLRFVSQIGRSVKGQDVFLNYQDGILREHSVGFYFLPEGVKVVNQGSLVYNEISNVEFIEGSTVTFGANSFTPVIDVTKSEDLDSAIALLDGEMQRYIDILRNGTGTDERLYEIEMGLKTLQSKYFELIAGSKKAPVVPQVIEKQPERTSSLRRV
jgi:HK97 family phage prohead protease